MVPLSPGFATFLLAAGSSIGSLATADLEQTESSIPAQEGLEPFVLQYGDHTVGAEIDTPLDLDSYVFCGEAGEVVLLVGHAMAACMTVRAEVFGPTGLTAQEGCTFSCVDDCSWSLRFALPETGCYLVVLSNGGDERTGPYELQLERLRPFPDAPLVAHGSPYTYEIGWGVDTDFVRFHGQEGELARISIDGLRTCLDAQVELLAPGGASLATEMCTASCLGFTCSLEFDQALPETGDYLLVLSDGGSEERGEARVQVSCLAGCPPATELASRPGSNVGCLQSHVTPAVGGTWSARVNTLTQVGATMSVVFLYTGALNPGLATPWGELLVDPGSMRLAHDREVVELGQPVNVHELDVPPDAALVGFAFSAQALVVGEGLNLCNAIDYVLGY